MKRTLSSLAVMAACAFVPAAHGADPAIAARVQALHWGAEPGRFELMLGSASDDIRLRGQFELADDGAPAGAGR